MPRPDKPDVNPDSHINHREYSDPSAQSTADFRQDLPEDEFASTDNPMTRVEATLALMSDWFANLQSLARAEFSRTLTAAAQILGLSLVLLPMAGAFIVSLCAGLGLIAYYFSQSIYIAFCVFLLAQLLLLSGILLYQKKLRTLLGFDETRRQVKEALNDVIESLK